MTIDKKELGNRIKEIRVAEKDTLEAFANKINKYSDGVIKSGKSNVSRWEKGENIPNDITLKAISDIGRVTVDELLYGNPNIKKTVDVEQTEKLEKFIENRRQVVKQELKLLANSSIEGFLSGIGLAKGLGDKGVSDYKKHQARLEGLEKIGKNYIESNYDNYTYEKFLEDFPDSTPQDFKDYKEKEWTILKEVLDNFWEAFDITNENNTWISSRFTDKISNELDKIKKIAVVEGKEHYYVNEVVQPFLDQAAKDFKEYIKDYIDIED